MSLRLESEPDDRQLMNYLLGLLPEEDAERLDEMSIAEDAIAWRLRVVEDDLVDAYVRGSLTGESLERFESFYLASPRRREKVKFARSFLDSIGRAAAPAPTGAVRDASPDPRPAIPTKRNPASAPRTSPAEASGSHRPWWSNQAWLLAAAAALLLLASGALLLQDLRLRTGLTTARNQTAALERRAQELERQLSDQSQAHADAVKELDRVNAALAALARQPAAGATRTAANPLATALLVLLPQTRAADPVASLTLPPDADRVTIALQLEANDFSRYQVELKDPATNSTLWRSSRLTPTVSDGRARLGISVPASGLKTQHYSFELSGVDAAGRPEVVGSYIVQIVRP